MIEVRLSSKGQLVIPKPFRDSLGLKSGKAVLITQAGNRLIIVPKPDDSLEGLVKAGQDIGMTSIRKDIKSE